MLGGDSDNLLGVGTDFGEPGERTIREHLFVGHSDGYRGQIGFYHGPRDTHVGNSGDNAMASPLLQVWQFMLKVARANMKAPGTVKLGITGNATEHASAKTSGRLDK
jgi:hypothetical protein